MLNPHFRTSNYMFKFEAATFDIRFQLTQSRPGTWIVKLCSCVISLVTENQFVCSLPASGHCTHLSSSVATCLSPSSPPLSTAPQGTGVGASLHYDIWSCYNCGWQCPTHTWQGNTMHIMRSAIKIYVLLTYLSVGRAWTFCQYWFGFNLKTTRRHVHLKKVMKLVLPTQYCRSRPHTPVSSASRMLVKPPHRYSHT